MRILRGLCFYGLTAGTILTVSPLECIAQNPAPGPLRVLVSLIVSVALMVWIVLPRLTQLFSGWLHPRPPAAPGS